MLRPNLAHLLSVALLVFALPMSHAAGGNPNQKFNLNKVALLTCPEAWQQSGQSSEKIIELVKSMAGYTLRKRHLTLPDTKEAGVAVGTLIKERCDANPDELLISIVDRSIRDHLKAN